MLLGACRIWDLAARWDLPDLVHGPLGLGAWRTDGPLDLVHGGLGAWDLVHDGLGADGPLVHDGRTDMAATWFGWTDLGR